VDKKNIVSSLIVTDKRIAFRNYTKCCCCTSTEQLESIKPDQIQGLKVISSPYVIEMLYIGIVALIISFALMGSAKDNKPLLYGGLLVLVMGLVCVATTFCGKLDRIIFYLKSRSPVLCFFTHRVVAVEVPIGEGNQAYDLIQSQVAKYQKTASLDSDCV